MGGSLVMREGHNKEFLNRLSSNIFGPKWDEVTGGRSKLDNEALDIRITSKTMRRAAYKHTRAAYKRMH
jgi:hypothetical protein